MGKEVAQAAPEAHRALPKEGAIMSKQVQQHKEQVQQEAAR